MSNLQRPLSKFLSDKTKTAIRNWQAENEKINESSEKEGVPLDLTKAHPDQWKSIREALLESSYSSSLYRSMIEKYPTDMEVRHIGGVYTEVFTPLDGVSEKNKDRVLINLHGGSFIGGERSGSHLESLPICSVGKIKVVSIDYRMAPEHQFPAGSDDVLSVYKDLLGSYKAEKIGIYGSSAGGLLTAQSLARFQTEGLPAPGGAAMLACGAYYWLDGDSGTTASLGENLYSSDLYFKGVEANNPLAFPGHSADFIRNFPPSLMIASTGDFALSSVIQTHSQLKRQGVETDLHIWEGLDHVFYFCADLVESLEVYEVVTEFFDGHLGQ